MATLLNDSISETLSGVEELVRDLPSEKQKRQAIRKELDKKVDRFLRWPLPQSVCSDLCVTDAKYPHQRFGTGLLDAKEARAMLEFVLELPDSAEGK